MKKLLFIAISLFIMGCEKDNHCESCVTTISSTVQFIYGNGTSHPPVKQPQATKTFEACGKDEIKNAQETKTTTALTPGNPSFAGSQYKVVTTEVTECN